MTAATHHTRVIHQSKYHLHAANSMSYCLSKKHVAVIKKETPCLAEPDSEVSKMKFVSIHLGPQWGELSTTDRVGKDVTA